jgi:hypothetical protein
VSGERFYGGFGGGCWHDDGFQDDGGGCDTDFFSLELFGYGCEVSYHKEERDEGKEAKKTAESITYLSGQAGGGESTYQQASQEVEIG